MIWIILWIIFWGIFFFYLPYFLNPEDEIIFMIFFLTRWIPFSFQKDPPVKNNVATVILLLVILIASVSIIEIVIILADFGLDIIQLSPSRSSPYDSYFMNPINSIIFLLLVVFDMDCLKNYIFIF